MSVPEKKKFKVTLEVELVDRYEGRWCNPWDARSYVNYILEKTRPHINSGEPVNIEVTGAEDAIDPDKLTPREAYTLRIFCFVVAGFAVLASMFIPGVAKYLTLGR